MAICKHCNKEVLVSSGEAGKAIMLDREFPTFEIVETTINKEQKGILIPVKIYKAIKSKSLVPHDLVCQRVAEPVQEETFNDLP